MNGAYARRRWSPDHPWGLKDQEFYGFLDDVERDWGSSYGIEQRVPSMANNPRFREWWGRYLRMSASPTAAATLQRMNGEIDIREVLPAIRVPTLILHSVHDQVSSIEAGRYLARRIPGAKLVELQGVDHVPFGCDADLILDEVEEFITGVRHHRDVDRVLATVLFADIVNATETAASLGDRGWHDLLDSHYALVRRELLRFRGQEIDTAGDGFLAAFDGPARAIRCARAIVEGVRTLGIEVRAGLHTGECEVMGEKVGGISVHIGARVAALARPGEVLVSGTVKDLVAGSGLSFQDRGVQPLKGVPGEWRLFAVAP
jgi:class 3 adenylate cyclase